VQLHANKQQTWTPFDYTNQTHPVCSLQTFTLFLSNISLLRHPVAQFVYALRYNQKVSGSITDGVIGIFHWHNPSGHTVALELTQLLTEMSTRNISWGKGGRCVQLTTLPPSCADCLEIWEPCLRLTWPHYGLRLGASHKCNNSAILRLQISRAVQIPVH